MPTRFALSIVLCVALMPATASAAQFVVTSPDFSDNALATSAGAQPACGGAGTSPALVWSGAPAGTKSFAIVLTDVDNWSHAGAAAHWVAYGIPASMTSIPAGFGTQTPAGYVSGLNFSNQPGFRGYCPTVGDAPHHYVYSVFATDLAPNALSAGLTRDALTAALTGHVLEGSSVVARYVR